MNTPAIRLLLAAAHVLLALALFRHAARLSETPSAVTTAAAHTAASAPHDER